MKNAIKSVNTKLLVAILAVVLVGICAIGVTIAWLVDTTDDVVNTFTDGHVHITLDESKDLDFKMIPGHTIVKDPVVTVLGGSEDCWLFVEIEESENLNEYIAYAVADGWTQGDGINIPNNVYYREVSASDADQAFGILGSGVYPDATTDPNYPWGDNQVLVLPTVTEEDMDAITTLDPNTTPDPNGSPLPTPDPQPTLTFTAYAVQLYRTNGVKFTPAEAWAQIRPTNTNS